MSGPRFWTLADLEASWIALSAGQVVQLDGPEGAQGVSFGNPDFDPDSPAVEQCVGFRLWFTNPVGGVPRARFGPDGGDVQFWERHGETLEELTLDRVVEIGGLRAYVVFGHVTEVEV